jgi:hypothetical protein
MWLNFFISCLYSHANIALRKDLKPRPSTVEKMIRKRSVRMYILQLIRHAVLLKPESPSKFTAKGQCRSLVHPFLPIKVKDAYQE